LVVLLLKKSKLGLCVPNVQPKHEVIPEEAQMPLSKARMRERKRLDRLNVKPKSEDVKPKVVGVLEGVQPDADGFYPSWAITNWRQFNGRCRNVPLPTRPNGR